MQAGRTFERLGGTPSLQPIALCLFEHISPLAPANGGGAPARGVGGLAPLHHNPVERKRERERVAILAQVLHLCSGVCDAPLHRGGR